jgi:sialidase-1
MTVQRRCITRALVLLTTVIGSLGVSAGISRAGEAVRQVDVFLSGTQGYHTYRIPAVVLTTKHTLLAFCEGRKTGRGDHGDLDLMLRRRPLPRSGARDGGKTWQPMQLVYEEGGTAKITIGNPCPVVDRQTGTVWLPFCRDNDRVFMTYSGDDGATWAKPVEITPHVKRPEWSWYATGPGHGVQLSSGRLVIPCDCRDREDQGDWDKRGHSLVFYSDDHGKSWTLGDMTAAGMNECEVVELADGSLLLSMRNYLGKSQRAFCRSTDGGLSWSEPRHHPQVYCPTCQSSIQRYSLRPKNIILYSGPGGPGRSKMTVRVSYDEGKTWPVAKVIYEGSAAYSDLVVLPDGTIGCLYERDDYQRITFARFTLDWLAASDDRK